jgi:hypothetical protein
MLFSEDANHQAKTKKNVEIDTMGDKLGRIHVGNQDLSELQTRKMRGLKRRAGECDEESCKRPTVANFPSPRMELPKIAETLVTSPCYWNFNTLCVNYTR